MATVELFDKERQVMETIELPESVFGAAVKTHLLHQVVVARRNASRSGTASTKTRKDIAGGERNRIDRREPAAPAWEQPVRPCSAVEARSSDRTPAATNKR